jgi:hypothetical protein
MLMRSCVFNDIKRDKKCLFGVTVLDFCKFIGLHPFARYAWFPRLIGPLNLIVGAAVGWSIRLDRKAEFCTRPERGAGTSGCHTALIVLGLVLAWISVIVCAL